MLIESPDGLGFASLTDRRVLMSRLICLTVESFEVTTGGGVYEGCIFFVGKVSRWTLGSRYPGTFSRGGSWNAGYDTWHQSPPVESNE